MYPHHQDTINKLVEKFQNDPRIQAIIVAGSIARHRELENSDVDIFAVVSDEEWASCQAHKRFYWYTRNFCNYPGGYVDGKIVDLQFLHDVAKRGTEPARNAFVGAFIAYSRLPELPDLLAHIPVYPEEERQERIRAFFTQVESLRYFVRQAEKRHDPYLLVRVASELTLYAGRMILAYNRILFPGQKWFLDEVAQAPQKPEGIMDRIQAVLDHTCGETVESLCTCLYAFTEWDRPPQGWVARFLEDSEWNWQTGKLSPGEW